MKAAIPATVKPLHISPVLSDKKQDDQEVKDSFNHHNQIGSAIDDILMDNATYFSIFHQIRNEETIELNKLLSLRPEDGSFLEKWNGKSTCIGS